MCGILGHFAFRGRAADARLWIRAVNCLAHRGPDDSTFWAHGPFAFGHRRLSIIDLSIGGRQPMATEDGQLVVTFNGEIYNYVELRQELLDAGYAFRSSSDTEVLLHGYRAWGTELPKHLIGMFVFAIADRRREELFVARDRFGEKPMLLFQDRAGVTFASEMAPLTLHPSLTRELDLEALGGYLCLNYVLGDRTLMAGVRRLLPATWRLFDRDGTARGEQYWYPPDPRQQATRVSATDAVDQLEHRLDRAVELALRSDVPVGIFLSGGIDSSLIASSAARSGRLSRAYCLTFEEQSYSELPHAQMTARRLGIPLTAVTLRPSAMQDFLQLVEHADDPLADSSSLAVYTLAREAARTNKVVLSGDGGDELFGGYLTYAATASHSRFTWRLPMPLLALLREVGLRLRTSERKVTPTYKLMRFLRAVDLPPSVAHFTWNGVWLPRQAADFFADPQHAAVARGALSALAARYSLPERPSLRDLQNVDIAEYLPHDILTKSDRMTMAHGLEARAPFLEPSLAGFALNLPDELKISRSGTLKWILRELAARRYGVEIGTAKKQGFSIPVHAWLRGPGRSLVDDLLSPSAIRRIPGLDAARVADVVADHMNRRHSYGFELWGLLVLSAWHRARIERAAAAPAGAGPTVVAFDDRVSMTR